MNTIPLPGILAQIAEATDEDAAILVARANGGRRVYIPRREGLKPGHWLVDAVGMDKAGKIADALGGGHIDLPLGPAGTRARTWRTIAEATRAGRSIAQTARLAGVDDATVSRHRAKLKSGGDDGQGSLF